MNYELRQVKHEVSTNGTETFHLYFHYGTDEARVTVTQAAGQIVAKCEELPADSHMDEIVLETVSETWTEDHGGAMGDVGGL